MLSHFLEPINGHHLIVGTLSILGWEAMKRLWCVVFMAPLTLAFAVGLRAEDHTQASLRARIAFLEIQLERQQDETKICSAQLAIATAPQRAKATQDKLAEAAKVMGCMAGVDWNANPPVCVPEPRKEP